MRLTQFRFNAMDSAVEVELALIQVKMSGLLFLLCPNAAASFRIINILIIDDRFRHAQWPLGCPEKRLVVSACLF